MYAIHLKVNVWGCQKNTAEVLGRGIKDAQMILGFPVLAVHHQGMVGLVLKEIYCSRLRPPDVNRTEVAFCSRLCTPGLLLASL